jgi:hypothetical protein
MHPSGSLRFERAGQKESDQRKLGCPHHTEIIRAPDPLGTKASEPGKYRRKSSAGTLTREKLAPCFAARREKILFA